MTLCSAGSEPCTLAEQVRTSLEAGGVMWPAPIYHFSSLGSTSDWLKEQARSGASAWTVVLADCQSRGRGRLGRTWRSPPGNLYLSILLPAPVVESEVALLPLMAGVAAAHALRRDGVEVRLKWPNDLVVQSGKLGGVLAEVVGAAVERRVVLGVGVNLNCRRADLPLPLRESATSLLDESGVLQSAADAAQSVLSETRVWYDALTQRGGGPVIAEWRRLAADWWWGRLVEVTIGSRVVRGVALGVDDGGGLILELLDGSRRSVLSGEVRKLRLEERQGA
jgi:BirA family transcriptional regulator, biotin operon repressor / biotin---[acetyl-CoA-carboxylase] ligase